MANGTEISETDNHKVSQQANGHTLDLEASPVESFFLGEVIEENLFPFPKIDADEAETLRMVLDATRKFMADNVDVYPEYDVEGSQPDEYISSLRELGLFGLIIPEEHGGIGFSNSAYSRVLQETSQYDASTSLTIGAHSSIGMKGLLLFGTDEQKKKYLPKLASGEMIAAFCLTEPGSGSDAASIKTKATKNEDGSWTLSGEKIWITNGPIADFFTVFARTDGEKGKISAFIVERGWDGITTGPKEQKMGIRASATSTVSFDNVHVPAENVLLEEGKGFKVAMSILNNGRTGLGGGCVGGIKRCIKLATQHATERKQFGKQISEFGLVQQKIAQMTVDCFAAESVVSMVGHYIDSGLKDFSVEAAISKVFSTEAMWNASNEALQVAGGNGFMREYPYEGIVRDCRINMIFEGTNEILRLYIALSGMQDAGQYLKEIASGTGNIFNDPIKGFGVLSGYAGKKFSQLTSLGRDRIESVHEELRDESAVYEQFIVNLSQATERLLRRYKKGIIDEQFLMKRIADVAIDLFVGLCVLSRVTSMINEKSVADCQKEISIARIFTQQAKLRMLKNLRECTHNVDEEMKGLSDFIVDSEGYVWDVF